MLYQIQIWARSLKRDVVALWLAARDPRKPWLAKAVAGVTAAYALSPIDLIPDFVPILGYLDDLVIVPAGIALAIRLIPAELMNEFREHADSLRGRPRSLPVAVVIGLIWAAIALSTGYGLHRWYTR